MKIVNHSGIPDSLFRYLSQDLYDHESKGQSLSATEIINPTQMVVLKRRYWQQIEVDAIDQIWKLLGTGVHAILEKEHGIEKIERLKANVFNREVSGRWDRIFQGAITDYKVTSAWSIVYGSREHEWRLQLSIYRWLYWKVKGVLLNSKGYIVALLRDWSEKNLDGKGRYPVAPAVEIPLILLDIDKTETYIEQRVEEITAAEALPDAKLPPCSDAERWYNKTKHVYMRCAKYCDVAKFCPQVARETQMEMIGAAEVA